MSENKKELRVRGSEHLHEMVETVAKNYGITVSQYLRMRIRAALEAEPENMKRPFID